VTIWAGVLRRFCSSQKEEVVDTEHGVGALVAGWEIGIGDGAGNHFRVVNLAGVAFTHQDGGPGRQDILEPIGVRSIREGNHETVVGLHRSNRSLIRCA
jgi:hypothetical protein